MGHELCKCAAPSLPLVSANETSGEEAERMKAESEETASLLTRSGLAQWPFRAVETLPIIRSFICWVASGLSLGKQRKESCYSPLAVSLLCT